MASLRLPPSRRRGSDTRLRRLPRSKRRRRVRAARRRLRRTWLSTPGKCASYARALSVPYVPRRQRCYPVYVRSLCAFFYPSNTPVAKLRYRVSFLCGKFPCFVLTLSSRLREVPLFSDDGCRVSFRDLSLCCLTVFFARSFLAS